MSIFRLIFVSLVHHWRMNLAVASGVAVATAVLTGALIVGDSMNSSLRHLVLDRLGKIDQVMVTNRFFRAKLAEEIAAADGFDDHFTSATPVILMQSSLINADIQPQRRASQVTLLGMDPSFWSLDSQGQASSPTKYQADEFQKQTADQVILNKPLAAELQVKVGDEVLIQLPQLSQIPAESALGKKTDLVRSRRFKVSKIIEAEGLGRFSLQNNQVASKNAFVTTSALQTMLNQKDKVNTILLASAEVDLPVGEDADLLLKQRVRPTLEDYGYKIVHIQNRADSKQPLIDYLNFSGDQMIIPPNVEQIAIKAFEQYRLQPALTYLANYIKTPDGKFKIPYSTVAAIDSIAKVGPIVDRDNLLVSKKNGKSFLPLADNEIVLNQWAYEDFQQQGINLQPGDKIELTYFSPESTHGEVKELSATFRLKAVVPLAKPTQPPTLANDPDLVPDLPGVTDQDSIAKWKPPFPYDKDRVRSSPPNDQDEVYWDHYRTTPKAFISLTAGRKIWNSRFGRTTSIRIPLKIQNGKQPTATELTDLFLQEANAEELGFAFLPIKRLSLNAAAGTTPFSVLFFGFSMFIIASALILIVLLFRLGVQQRASEIGLLAANGFSRWRIAKVFLGESILLTIDGGLMGTLLGVGFAWLMIVGLTTWWVSAISSPFLQLDIQLSTLAIGFGCGLFASLLVICWSLFRSRSLSTLQLLSGKMEDSTLIGGRLDRWSKVIMLGCFAIAIALCFVAASLSGEAQAGAFFGSGAMMLAGLLLLIRDRLVSSSSNRLIGTSRWPLFWLAIRGAARNRSRTVMTMALVAMACFLIVAVGAFRLSPNQQSAGNFQLMATSDVPLFHDLGTEQGRDKIEILNDDLKKQFNDQQSEIYSIKVQRGDDASCLNLYQSSQPEVLGLSQPLIERGNFLWAATLAETDAEKENPWLLLNRQLEDGSTAVVIDMNTAMYSLHLAGVGSKYVRKSQHQEITFTVVGLLKNSIFQGSLLVNQQNFQKLFPETGGFQKFLVQVPDDVQDKVQGQLEDQLSEYGFDVISTKQRLQEFQAVQNTYLSTFQSLGSLGLLLGTFGLATVQLRNVLERRKELALMLAVGYRKAAIARMIFIENGFLLIGGMIIGIISAVMAVLPHFFLTGVAVPWLSLCAMLATIMLVGIIAGMMAVRASLASPVVPALRGD